jgi:archaeosortase A (PGF-CTERM-specific)
MSALDGLLCVDAATGALAFVALAFLGAGFFVKGRSKHALRIAGWLSFAIYWPTQSMQFFSGSEPDPVNGWFTLLSPLFFGFLAYHEWQSRKWGEDPRALRWVTGTAFVAAGTYFAIYKIPGMTDAMIGMVAYQSSWLLGALFGVPNHVQVDWTQPIDSRYNLYLDQAGGSVAYAVTIILACTAIQSIMIFVGAIAITEGSKADLRKRQLKALAYTTVPIYVLNLFRNAGIVYGYKILGLTCCGVDSFEFMHSWVGKGGSLLALVLIALAVFKTLPELHQNILDLFDLPKRRKPGFFTGAPAMASTVAAAAPQPKGE